MRKLPFLFVLVFCFALLASKTAAAAPNSDSINIEVCRQSEFLVQFDCNNATDHSFSVRSNSKDLLHFYVFDTAGALVYHALLLPGSKRNVSDLRNGNYDYDIYLHSACIEQGKIKVQSEK